MNTKVSEVKDKIPNHDKYITTSKFSKFNSRKSCCKIKTSKVIKTDFDNKLTSYNRWIASNKAKHLQVQKKLDSLIKHDYNFFFARNHFASNDRSQNTFVYQPTVNTLELKKRYWLCS